MDRNHIRWIRLIFPFLVILGMNPAVQAVEFAGGTGTPNDPYQIATAEQFMAVGREENSRDRHFVLVADINLDPNLPGGEELYDSSRSLSGGSLDGGGHKVTHLRGSGPLFAGGWHRAGLGRDAVICNLVMDDVWLSKGPIIAGENEGLIVNCSADGVSAGGLVGINYGYVVNCSTGGTVTGGSGLVETNEGLILQCYSTAAVTGGDGLVGTNKGTIAACYATGTVIDGNAGLVGTNSGTITQCYATGNILSSSSSAGGLVRQNTGTISYCYATGSVSAQWSPSGFVAANYGTIIRSYCGSTDTLTPMASESSGSRMTVNCYFLAPVGAPISNYLGVPLTDARMRRQESFVGWDFLGDAQDGPDGTWIMPEEGGYPVLTATQPCPFAGGGTAEEPYLIESGDQLSAICRYPQAHFRLLGDLDLQGRLISSFVIPMFEGSFDGNRHRIGNFTLTGDKDIGLFRILGRQAKVTDLSLDRVHVMLTKNSRLGIDASGRAGVLASENRGLITGCSVTADITVPTELADYIGGLVGTNNGGEIRQCSARCFFSHQVWFRSQPAHFADYGGGLVGFNSGVVAESHACTYANGWLSNFGALVGGNEGTIVDCYAEGSVNGTRAGGLAGSNAGSVTRCYATTSVASTAPGGGLLACELGGSIAVSYFLSSIDGGGPDNGLGVVLSDSQMRTQASFIGWDFEKIWSICENEDYPRLQWEKRICGNR